MRGVIAAAVLLVARLSSAHESRQNEHGLLQFRPDGTSLLYEVTFPEGPVSARWFWTADLNRNGRLEEAEFGQLAASIAQELSRRVQLTLEGNRLPWRVSDAKVRASSTKPDGKLAAIVLLETREMPAGRRKIELRADPLVRSTAPAAIAFESVVGDFVEVVGGRALEGGGGSLSRPSVGLASGDRCRLLLNVEKQVPAR